MYSDEIVHRYIEMIEEEKKKKNTYRKVCTKKRIRRGEGGLKERKKGKK